MPGDCPLNREMGWGFRGETLLAERSGNILEKGQEQSPRRTRDVSKARECPVPGAVITWGAQVDRGGGRAGEAQVPQGPCSTHGLGKEAVRCECSLLAGGVVSGRTSPED